MTLYVDICGTLVYWENTSEGSVCFWGMTCLRLDRPYSKSKRNQHQDTGRPLNPAEAAL